jgi:hypothetical protein
MNANSANNIVEKNKQIKSDKLNLKVSHFS